MDDVAGIEYFGQNDRHTDPATPAGADRRENGTGPGADHRLLSRAPRRRRPGRCLLRGLGPPHGRARRSTHRHHAGRDDRPAMDRRPLSRGRAGQGAANRDTAGRRGDRGLPLPSGRRRRLAGRAGQRDRRRTAEPPRIMGYACPRTVGSHQGCDRSAGHAAAVGRDGRHAHRRPRCARPADGPGLRRDP